MHVSTQPGLSHSLVSASSVWASFQVPCGDEMEPTAPGQILENDYSLTLYSSGKSHQISLTPLGSKLKHPSATGMQHPDAPWLARPDRLLCPGAGGGARGL